MDEQAAHWDHRREAYQTLGLADKPSIFAETAVAYFPKDARVLELGAGNGQDSRFFASEGFEVVSTDFVLGALESNAEKIPEDLREKITVQKADLRKPLPFGDNAFDVVYAHLSLHYFDEQTTHKIFDEIARVLKPKGIVALLVNSTDDPEYGTGEQLEPDFFQIGTPTKRFFTTASAAMFTKDFDAHLLDNKGESYKDASKGIHGLIRFVGKKKEDA